MPVELMIYLGIGVVICFAVLTLAWFVVCEIDIPTIGFALLMIALWPLGIVAGTMALFEVAGSSNWKVERKKK